jgi:hypothetical protein
VDDLTSEFDIAWKEALEWFFEPFVGFFFPEIHREIDWSREPEFLDKELQQVVPEATTGRGTVDKLVKLFTLGGEERWALVHVEVQSQHDSGFAERMYLYNRRLLDKYARMPVSLAVFGDESTKWRPDVHHDGRWGCTVRFRYPTAKVLDYRGRDAVLEADPNPFAVVTLAHLKTLETRGDPAARYDWKFRMIKALYDRGLTRVQVQQLFRVMGWVMKLPKLWKTQLEQSIHKLEEEKKVQLLSPMEQMWHDEAMAKGLHNGIRVVLKLRFQQPGLDLLPRVKSITEPVELERLLEALETVPDLATFAALLPPQQA